MYIVGVVNGEGPPVPIPNTAVKLTRADNTCLETDREDRYAPTQRDLRKLKSLLFFSDLLKDQFLNDIILILILMR